MDLVQLRYFVLVSSDITMKQASELMHVSQSTLSMSIKKLEEELGVTLFDRSARRIKLNENGKMARTHAMKILADVDAMQREMEQVVCTTDTVTLVTDVIDFSMEASRLFAQLEPKISVEVIDCKKQDLAQKLLAGTCDMAVSLGMIRNPAIDSHLLLSEPMLLQVSLMNPLSEKKDISIRDLNGCKLATGKQGSGFRLLLDHYFDMAGIQPAIRVDATSLTESTLETVTKDESFYRLFTNSDDHKKDFFLSNQEVMFLAAMGNTGVTFIPQSHWNFPKKYKLGSNAITTAIPVREPFVYRNVYLHTMKNLRKTSATDKFRQFLVNFAVRTDALGCFPYDSVE